MPDRISAPTSPSYNQTNGDAMHQRLPVHYRLPLPASRAPSDVDEEEADYDDNTDFLLNRACDNAVDDFLEPTSAYAAPSHGADDDDDVAAFLNTAFYGYAASRYQEEASAHHLAQAPAETAGGPSPASAMRATFGHQAHAVLQFPPPDSSDELCFFRAPCSASNQNIQPQALDVTPPLSATTFLVGCAPEYSATGGASQAE